MIKVTVMYPNKPGARFDHAYYRDKHMPMVKASLAPSCRFYTIDKGLAGARGEPAPYVVLCHIHCDSLEGYQAAFGAKGSQILGDIPNYTDLQPVVQISEVVVGEP